MERRCAYCGCNNINCLAQCSNTKYYFCNGKGDTVSSHIVHHLKTSNFNQIILPEENVFHSIPLNCVICNSINIFELGFVFSERGDIYLVCPKCLDKISTEIQDLKLDSFQSIIQSDEIIHDIVKIPQSEEYSEVPISKVKAIEDGIQNELQQKPKDYKRHAKFQYHTVDEYVDLMSHLVNSEKSASVNLENILKFENISITRNDNFGTFIAPLLFDNISIGTRLSIKRETSQEYAYVISKESDFTVKVQFLSNIEVSNNDINMTVTVSVSFDPQIYENQISLLNLFRQNEKSMNKSISNLILGNMKANNELSEPPQFYQPQGQFLLPFTSHQIKSINHALSHRFSIIEGLPGTGKTTIIVALVNSFINYNIIPILVCAENDRLADILSERLSQNRLNVCRVYPLYFPNDGNLSYDLNALARRQYRSDYELHYKDRYKKSSSMKTVLNYQKNIIEKSSIICTTCDMLSMDLLKQMPRFNTVIIDDSQKVLDPQLIEVVTKQCQQLILVGDVLGFPPSINSSESKELRYDLSLFERLIASGFKPLLLYESFRSHPMLVDLLSTVLYKGFLKCCVDIKPIAFSKWPNESIPYFFWNFPQSAETCIQLSNGKSDFENEIEAKAISHLIQALIVDKIHPNQIGIITPFVSQHQKLINTLFKLADSVKNIKEIEIGNAEWFEGREKDMIIISTVRSNESIADFDKLGNQRYLNVALSRAKSGMIIIGNANSLYKNEIWKSIISYSIDKNVFVEGQLDSLKPSAKPSF